MDLASLLVAADAQPAVPLVPVAAAGLDPWLKAQSERTRTAVAASAKAPSTVPMAVALKPRSWPSTGTRKVCTSQQDASSQLTSIR